MWTVKKKKLRFDSSCNPITDKEIRICKDVVRGSLTLHSDRNAYKDGVLYYKWSIEDQPKDHDFKTACPRNLHRSTYRRLGCSHDPTAKSVYTLTNDEFITQKAKPIPKISHRDVSKNDDSTYLMFEREKKVACESGLKYILPHIHEDPRKFRSFTTNIDHYRPPLPLIYTTSTKTKAQLERDEEMEKWLEYHTKCVKRTRSQFTDLNGIKRSGIHTWLDESGIYPNTCLRRMHPYYIRKESPFVVRVV